MVEVLERRSFFGHLLPAVQHHVKQLLWTLDWTSSRLVHASTVAYEHECLGIVLAYHTTAVMPQNTMSLPTTQQQSSLKTPCPCLPHNSSRASKHHVLAYHITAVKPQNTMSLPTTQQQSSLKTPYPCLPHNSSHASRHASRPR